jgi:hypothetical protein
MVSFGQSSSSSAMSAAQQKKEQRKEHLNQLMKQQEEGTLIYQKQTAFGVKLNTDGLGFFFEHGKYKTVTKTNLWWIDLGERHNKKEDKQSNEYTDGYYIYQGSPFIYGKINNFYYLKLGFGQQLLIGGKGNQNGVAVSFIYGGGITAGLLKPYYLNVTDSLGNTTDIKYSAQTDSAFLGYTDQINQGSGFGKGLNEITIVPGLHARAALRFDYGRFNQTLSAIEVGVSAEYYTKDMQIMLNQTPQKFFFSGYVAFAFGSRK